VTSVDAGDFGLSNLALPCQRIVNGYIVFFNINTCREDLEDVRLLTEYAHDCRAATDYASCSSCTSPLHVHR